VWALFSLIEDRLDWDMMQDKGRKYERAFVYMRDGMLLSLGLHPNINSSTLH
jgi:hypothetical protein